MRVNTDFIREVQEMVRTAPYPDHMSMQLADMNLDRATVTLDLGTKHLQPFGLVHGGVIATLIDTATFWAVFMRIPEESGLVNVDLKLNYLKAVRTGRLTAEGSAIRSGRSISYSEAKVYDESGEIVAHGTSTLMALPGKGLPTKTKKFLD